jgi:hypothetical protein
MVMCTPEVSREDMSTKSDARSQSMRHRREDELDVTGLLRTSRCSHSAELHSYRCLRTSNLEDEDHRRAEPAAGRALRPEHGIDAFRR